MLKINNINTRTRTRKHIVNVYIIIWKGYAVMSDDDYDAYDDDASYFCANVERNECDHL